MKLLEILGASAARPVKVTPPSTAQHYGSNLVRAINERYGFIEFPTKISDLDYKNGVKFRKGLFESHNIDMDLLEDGIKVYCLGGTDLCDAFLDDLLSAAIRFGVELEETAHLRIYSSAIECEFNGNIEPLFNRLNTIGQTISGLVSGYGGPPDLYRGIGLVFLGRMEAHAPGPFRIERRVNHPMDSNVFFSSAPLRTTDHINVLHQLEELVSSTPKGRGSRIVDN